MELTKNRYSPIPEGGIMFERYTDRARRVVVLAQEEARMLNHDRIGTEHILLGLIHEGEGVACQALESFDITLEQVRQEIEATIGRGEVTPRGHIPFTPRAYKVLELALREALQLGHNHIGTEHLLLALTRPHSMTEGQAGGAVLEKLGLDLSVVHTRVLLTIASDINQQYLGGQAEKETDVTQPEQPPTVAQQALRYVLDLVEQLAIEQQSLQRALAICESAEGDIQGGWQPTVEALNDELNMLQTRLDTLSEREDALRNLIPVQQNSKKKVAETLDNLEALLS